MFLTVSPAVALPLLAAVTQAARQPVSLSQEAHKNNLSIWTETLFALKAQPMFLSLMLRTGTSQVKILVWWKQRELRETFGLLVTWEWQQNTREKYVCVFCALKLSLCYSKQRKKFLGERNSDSRLKLTFRLGWFVTSAILFSNSLFSLGQWHQCCASGTPPPSTSDFFLMWLHWHKCLGTGRRKEKEKTR